MIAYTSVNSRPISPYPPNCETVALAFPSGSAADGVRVVCQKYSNNPILPGAPASDVVAWRDPYVREWATLDKLRGKEEGETLYGIIAGGYKDVGSALFLYEMNKQSIENWTYLGDFGSRSKCWGQDNSRWAADMRDIFEVANFVTLNSKIKGADGKEEEIARDFFLMSAASVEADDPSAKVPPQRPARQEIFVSGEITLDKTKQVTFQPRISGYIDRGNYYAMNTFYDPARGAVVAHSWITEDDVSHEKRREQGWSGCLAIPRTIALEAIQGVKGCLVDKLDEISSVELLPGSSPSTFTILGLRILPCEDVLHQLQSRAQKSLQWESGSIPTSEGNWIKLCNVPSRTAIFQATVDVSSETPEKIELSVRHNRDHTIGTSIIFDPTTATMTLDRSKSVPLDDARHYDTRPEVVPHTLFRLERDDAERLESLELLVILDHGTIEVFANGRTAITTKIYTGHQPGCDGISLRLGNNTLCEAKLWHDIRSKIEYV